MLDVGTIYAQNILYYKGPQQLACLHHGASITDVTDCNVAAYDNATLTNVQCSLVGNCLVAVQKNFAADRRLFLLRDFATCV